VVIAEGPAPSTPLHGSKGADANLSTEVDAMTNIVTTAHLTSTCPRCGASNLVSVATSPTPPPESARGDISRIFLDDAARADQYDSLLSDGRARLIFRQFTSLGSVSVWKSRRASAVIHDLRIDELDSGREIQRQRIIRPLTDHLLRHVLTSLDGERHFVFEEQGDSFGEGPRYVMTSKNTGANNDHELT
jgi:hypothetical protein